MSIENLIGDGDGPAIAKKNPGLIVARQATGNVRVGREGELVCLTIGNASVRFQHQDAIRIGQWLMAKGVEAQVLVDGPGPMKRIEV